MTTPARARFGRLTIAALICWTGCERTDSPPAPAPETTTAEQPAAPQRRTGAEAWPMFRGDPRQTGASAAILPDKLDMRWKFTAPEGVNSTAAIVGDVVYVGCDSGLLFALDLADGAERWRFQATEAIRSSPTVADGAVYFGDSDGVFFAVDAQSGAERWRFPTQGEILSSAHVVTAGDADPRVIFGSNDGGLYCLNTTDGALVWKYEMADRVHGAAAIVDGAALASGCDGYLHIVSLSDGVARDKIELGGATPASPAVQGDRAYLGVYSDAVVCVDTQKGEIAWRFHDAENPGAFVSSAAVRGEAVIVAGHDKRVRRLAADSGVEVWSTAVRKRVESSPVIVGERVFVGTIGGELIALGLADGQEQFRFTTGAGVYASPAVVDGALVIGAADGVVYCLGEPEPAP